MPRVAGEAERGLKRSKWSYIPLENILMCVIEKGLFKKLLLITVKSPRDAIESKVDKKL